jgi:hypothetical protein
MQLLDISNQPANEAEANQRLELKKEDLREQIKHSSIAYMVAAGLSLLSSGLLPIYINMMFGVGLVEFLHGYAGWFGRWMGLASVTLSAFAFLMLLLLALWGFLAASPWPFRIAVALCGIDFPFTIMTMSIGWAGWHGFLILMGWRGMKAAEELAELEKQRPPVSATVATA